MRDYDNDRDRALAASRGQAACADPYSNHKHKPRPEDGAGPLCKKGMASRDSVNSRYSPDPCKILDDPKEGKLTFKILWDWSLSKFMEYSTTFISD